MTNFELSDQDKARLRHMNLFEGYQCERDPTLWKFTEDHNCINTLGIIVSSCLECPNWKSLKEKDEDYDE